VILTDHVLVENVLDFLRHRQSVVLLRLTTLGYFLTDDVVAELDALVTNEYGGPRNQLADLVLGFAAKRTVKELAVLVLAAGVVAHENVPL
jgi:hypothetical protein